VIGIVTFKIVGGENLNFAIPVNYLRGLMDSPLSALSLEGMRAKLANQPDVFKTDLFPTRWKSLQTGTTKIIRRDGDRIYVETVQSEPEKNAGCFNLSELQKKDDIFVGTNRISCVCKYTRGLGVYAQSYNSKYTYQAEIEISKLSPTRIEGRTMLHLPNARFDCVGGTFAIPPSEWQTFAWIPE